MINLCTLFDSNYLDRGIVLYQSLEKCCKDFSLYIFCFDEESYRILFDMNLEHAIIVSEEEILDEELVLVKSSRKRAEYCWTCTPIIVEYVLDKYSVNECTYIDADMCFYSDPKVLLDEFHKSNSSVGIMEHRFLRNFVQKKRERSYGKYCVEFNTFRNDSVGRDVLQHWKSRCLEQCTMEFGKENFGDQKYVEEWERIFPGIYVYQDYGAGVAPWNIADYTLAENDEKIRLYYRKKEQVNLIFYHFQSLMVLNNKEVFIGVYNELGRKDKNLIKLLYSGYIQRLFNVREELRKRGFEIPIQELRMGEKSGLRSMKFIDFVMFIYQCIPSIVHGRKNYIALDRDDYKEM